MEIARERKIWAMFAAQHRLQPRVGLFDVNLLRIVADFCAIDPRVHTLEVCVKLGDCEMVWYWLMQAKFFEFEFRFRTDDPIVVNTLLTGADTATTISLLGYVLDRFSRERRIRGFYEQRAYILRAATVNDQVEVIQYLHQTQSASIVYWYEWLHHAADRAADAGSLSALKYIVTLLREAKASSVDLQWVQDAVKSAAERGDMAMVKYMFETFGTATGTTTGKTGLLDTRSETCARTLYAAAVAGHHDIVRFLITRGVDVDANEGIALAMAAEDEQWELVTWLLGLGANVRLLEMRSIAYNQFWKWKRSLVSVKARA